MNEDLDRLLAYRNFLAAEDHLDELLYGPKTIEEEAFLTGLKNEIEYLRDDVMPKEVDKNFHCVVKHLSLAYEACREVAKATHEDLDINRANACREILITVLEKLWGRKIVTCERCGVKEENGTGGIQEENTRSFVDTTLDGLTRESVQRVGSDRIYGLYSSEASSLDGDEDSEFKRSFKGRESQSSSDPFGESA